LFHDFPHFDQVALIQYMAQVRSCNTNSYSHPVEAYFLRRSGGASDLLHFISFSISKLKFSFVPAESATLGIVDKSKRSSQPLTVFQTNQFTSIVFTRVQTRESVSKVTTLQYFVILKILLTLCFVSFYLAFRRNLLS
jgi:hypothetical protein